MKKFYRLFCRDKKVLSCTPFFMMIVFIMCSTPTWLVKHPISWSIDVTQLLLTWVCFLGADVTFRRNELVGLDLFTREPPEKVQKAVTLVIRVIILGVLMIFIAYGLRLSVENWKRSFQTLAISYPFVTFNLPVSSVLMNITALLKIKESVSQLVEAKKQSLEVEV